MRTLTLAAAALALTACGEPPAKDAPSAAGTPSTAATPATSVPPTPAQAVVSETREFRDWRAVCDNGNACMAWTGVSGGWVRVTMDAGPDAVPTVTAGSWTLGEPGQALADAGLRTDGRDHALKAGPKDAANAAAGAERARGIVAGLAAARSLEITAGDKAEPLPVSGASAALLWIDERQGRLDTTTALIRRGPRPASAVPAAPALPRVIPATAVDQTGFRGGENPQGGDVEARLVVPAAIEALPDVRQCRADTNEYLRKAVLAVRLGPDAELWGIPCDSGAYNATYILYVTDRGGARPRPAELPLREPRAEGDIGGGEDGPWLVNPVFDPKGQTLTVFPRGRGIGDCGTITTWTWTGRAFALSEERFMGDCWGISSDLWPTLWRTR